MNDQTFKPRGERPERRPSGHPSHPRSGSRPGARPDPRAGAEAAIIATLHTLEKPLTTRDFAAQKPLIAQMVERLRPLRLSSIEALDFEARTRLFTALLRAGRQGPVADDPEREAARKSLLVSVADLWRALGDDRRAALVYSAAGEADTAVEILAKAGDWREVVELLTQEGRHPEAARLLEQKHEHARAAESFQRADDFKGMLRTSLIGGKIEWAREAAKHLPFKTAREILLRHGGGDLVLDLLAGRGDYFEIAQLYARGGQWSDAAQAFEQAKRPLKALEAWQKAERPEEAERVLMAEAEALCARNDRVGAGQLLRRHGRPEKANELVREHRPEIVWRWLQQDGLDAEALSLARQEAQRFHDAGEPRQAALWLERGGELAKAAETYTLAEQHLDAQRLHEQLGDWDRAGEAAARQGARDEALAFFRRAGVENPEERYQALAPAPA